MQMVCSLLNYVKCKQGDNRVNCSSFRIFLYAWIHFSALPVGSESSKSSSDFSLLSARKQSSSERINSDAAEILKCVTME